MRKFKSLNPEELPATYDVEIFGEEPIVEIEEKEGRITIKYVFPGFYLSDDARDVEGEPIAFEQVNIAKTGFLGESGKPLLPSFGRYVQIPFNCDYTVTVEKGKPLQFENILVLPAQEKLTDADDGPLEYDKEFYQQDQFYPEEVVDVSGPFEIDGYNALLLHVRPLQYNPAKKKLIGYGTITVTIFLTPKESPEYSLPEVETDREAYGNLFLNPERRGGGRRGEYPSKKGKPPSRTPPTGEGPEFLIIYHDTFKKAAEALAQWKNMRGLPTDMVSITKVGATVSEIKEYIREMKESPSSQLSYVLLIGDVDTIPSEKITDSPSGYNITDYYYSTRKDPQSGTEFVLPWLSIGRMTVKTAEEAVTVVDKIIAYEKNPPEDPGYYTRMLFAAYFQDKRPRDGKAERAYMKTMEEIRKHMVALGFSVERVYVTSNPDMREYLDGTEVPDEVKAIIVDKDTATEMLKSAASRGYLTIGHRDHGGSHGWVHPPFWIYHLDDIQGDTPSVFYSINCLTGRFDSRSERDSFAEKLLKVKGGAPSVIAATRPSHTWLNDDLMNALFDALWAGVLPTFPGGTASYSVKYHRLGDVLNYAKTYLPVALSGSRDYIKDHFEIYHVIGDPTLELWTGEPFTVNMRAAVTRGYLDIVMLTCPKGSVITIWHKGKKLKRIEPSSRHVRVSLRDLVLWPSSEGEISVCFWAPGCRFQEITV